MTRLEPRFSTIDMPSQALPAPLRILPAKHKPVAVMPSFCVALLQVPDSPDHESLQGVPAVSMQVADCVIDVPPTVVDQLPPVYVKDETGLFHEKFTSVMETAPPAETVAVPLDPIGPPEIEVGVGL